jgi:hypothetical protein
MRVLKNVALAAAIAVSVGFLSACADQAPPKTTTIEYSTTAPATYVAPPQSTSSTATTNQYPDGTVTTSTTPVYSNVVTRPALVMVPSSPPVRMMPPTIVQVPNSAVMAPVSSETTTSTS